MLHLHGFILPTASPYCIGFAGGKVRLIDLLPYLRFATLSQAIRQNFQAFARARTNLKAVTFRK